MILNSAVQCTGGSHHSEYCLQVSTQRWEQGRILRPSSVSQEDMEKQRATTAFNCVRGDKRHKPIVEL